MADDIDETRRAVEAAKVAKGPVLVLSDQATEMIEARGLREQVEEAAAALGAGRVVFSRDNDYDLSWLRAEIPPEPLSPDPRVFDEPPGLREAIERVTEPVLGPTRDGS